MARRNRPVREQVDFARNRIKHVLTTPLSAVAESLGRCLEEGVCSHRAGKLPADKLVELCSYVLYVADRLPQKYGERFFFDAAMIRAMAKDWGGSLALSSMVIPLYGRTWGHGSLMMPSENHEDAHLIDVIVFPGDDRLEAVDLLDYPWMAHELGHYVLFRDDSSFKNVFMPALDKRLRSLKLSAIADRGAARVKAEAIINELRKLWTPSPDQRNWAHELAIDIIAVWTCGPAYLGSFKDQIERPQTNPYEITQNHPPYEVRLCALVDASRNLGFSDHAEGLSAIAGGWAKSNLRRGKNNKFLALADRGLIHECTQAAFRFCESLNLTKWTSSKLDVARAQLLNEANLDLGVDLLLSARVIFEERGESALDEWERITVRQIAENVMRLSR